MGRRCAWRCASATMPPAASRSRTRSSRSGTATRWASTPGFGSASTGGPPPERHDTDDETFLRGAQVTNADGIVQFKTVYPGWYPGRTVHIHAMVHLDRTSLLTTQLYFDDEFTERIYADAPYSQAAGRDTLQLR